MFEKRSTPKMSKLKEAHSPESEVIVKTAKDGCAEGLVYSGGGKDGIYIKEVVPESPASKSLKLKEGDQILSATVYFDNVPYEDAIQILEHAQAYKMKLCLKRKPDITQTDAAIESNVIPEGEELKSPEMRKTKRRGDARISWPKFPSLGRGRKNRFTRSHSSSEAEEQRKLELSPTTSDTESPIKSQDALKGKKKHKTKLSVLTKRGRISSSEDQDTDAATSAQISSDVQQAQESDMLSPEYLEESPQVFVTEHLKLMEDAKIEQSNEMQKEAHSPQHKVELISIDSTLKTTDLTVALADPESPSGIKSPDGKKNKKERSELKIKILGKDKSHKKAKSPKRLKTLGASLEVADGPESLKSEVVTSQEVPAKLLGDQTSLDISAQEGRREQKGELDDVTVTQKYPHKEKQQKSKSIKKFKLPRFGSSDTPTEETTKKSDDEECIAKNRQLSNETTEDPYDKLSKRTQLPKREEIEIPGMEDMSKTKAQDLKKPKAGCTGENYEIQSETVQLSIDVDSVKEAVSKLPGYKLPKVDTSGMPIPEEITVIDANAQRISMKTPTKVVESRTKHETHFIKFGTTGHSENTKPSFKLPKMRSVDLTTEELLFETKEQKSSQRDNKTSAYERENIILPGHQRSHAFDRRGDGIQGQKTIFLHDEEFKHPNGERS
ncbi:protein AHNAK2-like isoform X2 [Gouania willdenowi]|nr:protein AHNAK2-like isoform X2 [Gouania willdenowi]